MKQRLTDGDLALQIEDVDESRLNLKLLSPPSKHTPINYSELRITPDEPLVEPYTIECHTKNGVRYFTIDDAMNPFNL
ncbi:hypothetical protein HYW74_00345 [Candidatus Pacearchaeota archaeon]|nr:hypothetical protein [Candidatus Pacearchaeota archaeon]